MKEKECHVIRVGTVGRNNTIMHLTTLLQMASAILCSNSLKLFDSKWHKNGIDRKYPNSIGKYIYT